MIRFSFKQRTGHDLRSWPVLLLLLVVVLVPTACLLWFMSEAMRNGQLAVQQRLADAYRAQLDGVARQLEDHCKIQASALEQLAQELSPAELFARSATGLADAVVCRNDTGGWTYPAAPDPIHVPLGELADAWSQARHLEHKGTWGQAAGAYALIARQSESVHHAGQALMAQARCLVQDGDVAGGAAVVTGELSQPRFATAADPQGRLIAPSAWLWVLESAADRSDPIFADAAVRLAARLADYGEPLIPAGQRRFLMKRLAELTAAPALETLHSEELAARYQEINPPAPQEGVLTSAGFEGIWHMAVPGGRVIALYKQDKLLVTLRAVVARQALPADTSVMLEPPAAESTGTVFLSRPAGRSLPGWRLALVLRDERLFDNAAERQIAVYIWTSVLVIAVVVILALLIAWAIGRQMRLTRLKNDLVATISHELKTPLASMRLLVDTLLNGSRHDDRKVREYLELIAKENSRLSRLIENFLTFSRMERNKQKFNRVPISAAAVARAAAGAAGERFHAPRCRFDVEVAADLPEIVADPDVLVTAVLNLLDNAYKYTKEDKHITLRAYGDNGHVCFAVHDNGIGLSRRAARHIFERFYQVDQRLSRSGSGCGLGLSIVRFIVTAHGGSVDVTSQPDAGSTFTVTLPAASPTAGPERAAP